MIIILMGVSGSGKTTLGKRLAADLNWPFYDGDDFHPQANVEKMARGEALTDDDRWPWLDALRQHIDALLAQGKQAILACSALKHSYRERLLAGHAEVRMVYLQGSYALIRHRLQERDHHFMPADLLMSQFETLEEPQASEEVLTVDIAQPLDVLSRDIQRALGLEVDHTPPEAD
jgi:gluconokinase